MHTDTVMKIANKHVAILVNTFLLLYIDVNIWIYRCKGCIIEILAYSVWCVQGDMLILCISEAGIDRYEVYVKRL